MNAPRLGQLRWRCRRGMKELDVLLERYVDERYASASAEDQRTFERMLESQDNALYAYCMGQESPPAHLAALIQRIIANPPPEL